jgi:dienelactone hydrolase
MRAVRGSVCSPVFFWFPALLCLLVQAPAGFAQNTGEVVPDPQVPATPDHVAVRYLQKEMVIPDPLAFPNGLDAVEVRADIPGRHPLVVLTHGTSDKEEERAHVTPWAQLRQAMWFARRGYVAIVVARRGYGRSGGQRDGNGGGCGDRVGSFKFAGEASADDLRVVIRFGQGLAEADPNTVVSIGISTGGFAQVALSANPPPGLKAAINFAGGRGSDGHEHNCNLGGLIAAYADFGKSAHKHGDLPMLWVYSQNDHWFTPSMAKEFEAAYDRSGASEQFVLAPADRDEGHHLYGHISAWSDTVQAFLKAHNLLPLGDEVLPAPQPPNVSPPAGLHDQGLQAWKEFLLEAPYKTFATNGQGVWGIAQAAFDQQIADQDAIDRCKKAAAGAGTCAIVARTPGVK